MSESRLPAPPWASDYQWELMYGVIARRVSHIKKYDRYNSAKLVEISVTNECYDERFVFKIVTLSVDVEEHFL